MYHRGAHEIAGPVKPFAPLPPPARILSARDKPISLTNMFIGAQACQ